MSAEDGEDQDMQNPQSWNLYSYVQNNPLANTDPEDTTASIRLISRTMEP
jgi:hypothetical protein